MLLQCSEGLSDSFHIGRRVCMQDRLLRTECKQWSVSLTDPNHQSAKGGIARAMGSTNGSCRSAIQPKLSLRSSQKLDM
jgi:hypothetical protein